MEGDALQSMGKHGSWTHHVALCLAIVISAMAAINVYQAVIAFRRIQQGLSSIPSAPGSRGLLGHVSILLTCTPWDYMTRCVLEAPPVVKFRLAQRFLLVVGTAKGLKQVFQTGQRNYEKDLDFSFQPFLPILGTGLVTAHGDLWQQQRLLIGPALRVDILEEVPGIAMRAAGRLCTRLEQARGTGQSVDMEVEFRLMTLQIIGEAVLSLHPDECDRVFPQLYLPVMEESNLRALRPWRKYIPSKSWVEYQVKMWKLNQYIKGILQKRWAQRQSGLVKSKTDLLDRMLASLEGSGTSWSSELLEQLCYEVKTFLLAGHETSAAMLTWSLAELIHLPASMAKVRAEAGNVFGPSNKQPSQEAAQELTYTLSCLKESLRKYSVVPVVTRKAVMEDEICGYRVPSGTYIACCIQAVHQSWKSPDAWQPERFLPGGEFDSFPPEIKPYMFMPFIQGPRNCLGQNFALLEARIVLALLCKKFSFVSRDSSAPLRHPGVIPVGPWGGLHVIVK